jgi:hypothetical protein
MAESNETNIVTDFRKWYDYSQSAASSKMSNRLKMVIRMRESQPGFTFEANSSGGETIFYITESYNPAVLRLTEGSCHEFLELISTRYPGEEVVEKFEIQQLATNPEVISSKKEQKTAVKNSFNGGFLLKLSTKISSPNKAKHSLYFSLVTFVILQINLLPGNVGPHELGGWGIYFFFGVWFLIAYLQIWSYSKLYYNIKSYGDIFKLSALYGALFFLYVALEITGIDLIRGKVEISILWTLFFTILLQSLGIMLSLFITVVLYFVKGGKMINYKP